MPSYTRGENRDLLTYVRIGTGASNVFYGFSTKEFSNEQNVSEADVLALGHYEALDLPQGALYFLRSQSPKPGRMKKSIRRNPGPGQKASVSSFYGAGSVQAAMKAGWKIIKRPRGVSLSSTARYVKALCPMSNGLMYCFPMNRNDFDLYSGLLGLQTPATITNNQERLRLVQACSFPRPGRASIKTNEGAEFSSFFAYNAYENLIQQEWKILEEELIDLEA